MKKLQCLFIFLFFLNSVHLLNAQTLGIEETKKILSTHKWVISHTQKAGVGKPVEDDVKGMRWVLKADGKGYSYMPSEKEDEVGMADWSITKTHLIIDHESEETRYPYRIEKASVYYLYLEDVEVGVTCVFKQAERIEDISSKKHSLTYFEELEASFVNVPQWRYSFTKGESVSMQRKKISKEFPSKEIQQDWKEDYYITGISFGGATGEKNWMLLMSKNEYTGQVWRTKKNTDELEAAIVAMKSEKPDHYVSHIAYGDDKWIMVGSKGTGYTAQTTIISKDFPEKTIAEYGGKGFSITDLAYGAGSWVVGMSKVPFFAGQNYQVLEEWDDTKIDEHLAKGYFLTESVKQGNKWYLVFSKDKNIKSQDIETLLITPDDIIESRWDKGYQLHRTFYY